MYKPLKVETVKLIIKKQLIEVVEIENYNTQLKQLKYTRYTS